MSPKLLTALSEAITKHTGSQFQATSSKAQGGGCIHEAVILSDGTTHYFVKLNRATNLHMFEAEAEALSVIARTGTLRTPKPIAHGHCGESAYLILEALSFGTAHAESWQKMGQQLARLHRFSAEDFGWHRDNTIGATPQQNTWTPDWPSFFREQRLLPQFKWTAQKGYAFKNAAKLLEQVEALLAGHAPAPSLLHGDLWSGNASFLNDGTPVIYDPAFYYGDRETDLAFSEFFGGFPTQFYNSYQSEWPTPPGYEKRKDLYNLYHVLNHANLFGGSYVSQAEQMIRGLLQ